MCRTRGGSKVMHLDAVDAQTEPVLCSSLGEKVNFSSVLHLFQP